MPVKLLFGFSMLALVWSIYYLAMRKTGGILNLSDKIVCGTVIAVCLIIIAYSIYRRVRNK